MLQLLEKDDVAQEDKDDLLDSWFGDGAIITSAQFLRVYSSSIIQPRPAAKVILLML